MCKCFYTVMSILTGASVVNLNFRNPYWYGLSMFLIIAAMSTWNLPFSPPHAGRNRNWSVIPWYWNILDRSVDRNDYSFFPVGWHCPHTESPNELGPTGNSESSPICEISFCMVYHFLGQSYDRAVKQKPCPCAKMTMRYSTWQNKPYVYLYI